MMNVNSINLQTFIPVLLFLFILLCIGFYAAQSVKNNSDFQKEYFLGSRNLGGVVLAMTLIATYGSVSSFVSGPGIAWDLGLGWVVFAAPQIITGFLILGVVGKKMAVLSRITGSLTVIDIIYKRFNSKTLSLLLALVLLIFFTAMTVGQFIGGAQIFAAITGLDYKAGLILFAAVTVIYTSGGFKAVALTDAACAILMLTGMFLLCGIIFDEAGGLDSIMSKISSINLNSEGVSRNLLPDADGALPYTLLFSAWLLVGFGTIGLPQSLVRCMSYKQTSDLHRAMIIGTIICGALMIGMTLLGVFARAVIEELPQNGTDSIIPTLIVTKMNPFLAGATLLGPLAATMSTVSSLLIAASSAVIKDIYGTFLGKNSADHYGKIRTLSIITTYTVGLIALLLALFPMDIVAWVNLFAFGGLETAFLMIILLGLFWQKMNTLGAFLSLGAGSISYITVMSLHINFLGFHNIVVGLFFAAVFAVIGSYIGKSNDEKTLKTFFPHKY